MGAGGGIKELACVKTGVELISSHWSVLLSFDPYIVGQIKSFFQFAEHIPLQKSTKTNKKHSHKYF